MRKRYEVFDCYKKLKKYADKLGDQKLNELIDDFKEKVLIPYLRLGGREEIMLKIRRPSSTDLTWEEKNPAVYVSKPLDVGALEKFAEEEERKLNSRKEQ